MSTTLTDVDKIKKLPVLVGAQTLNIVFVLLTFSGSVFILFLDEFGQPVVKSLVTLTFTHIYSIMHSHSSNQIMPNNRIPFITTQNVPYLNHIIHDQSKYSKEYSPINVHWPVYLCVASLNHMSFYPFLLTHIVTIYSFKILNNVPAKAHILPQCLS